jgi:hypothetical protein
MEQDVIPPKHTLSDLLPLIKPTSKNFHHLPIISSNSESISRLTHGLGPSPHDPNTPKSLDPQFGENTFKT